MADETKRKIKRFFQITLTCLSAGIFLLAAVFWFVTQGAGGNGGGGLNVFSPAEPKPQVPERTNFAIFGTDDDGTRTDTIIAGTFNSGSGAVDLISIPRDTYVVMPESRLSVLRAEGRYVPSDGAMKINAVHHYAGKEHGTEYTVAQIEDLLGIEIDYSATVNLSAFRYIVDAIGGVEFDVPQRMYYRDPGQGLYIDLRPGMQTLDGSQAEQLVRYRKPDISDPQSAGYPMGDLQRVQVQQAFLKALISQAMAKENLLSATGALVTTVYKYVETDFGMADLPKYLGSVKDFSPDKVSAMTLPGDAKTIGGQSYVIVREPDAGDMLESVFGSGETVYESSLSKTIIVLNGGQTKGKANDTRKLLEEAGYLVESIGDYAGQQQEATRILVRKRGQGADLAEFFNEAEILIDPQTDCDIKIIVGIGG